MSRLRKILAAESDAELLLQYKTANDMEALGELFNRHMELVYGVCLKYVKEPEEAKDCVINIFEELTTKLKKYEVENFRGWLYQLAKNHCLMKLRGNKKLPVMVDPAFVYLTEDNHLDDIMQKEMKLSSMKYCIEQLPGEQKAVIQLFYLEEKCYKEIAETTNTDVTKVRSYIQNGRRNLKICMEKNAFEQA